MDLAGMVGRFLSRLDGEEIISMNQLVDGVRLNHNNGCSLALTFREVYKKMLTR